MPKAATRKFGAVPEWAKRGHIDLRNYPYRAEAHCALHSSERNGEHPTVRRDSIEGREWIQYFEHHLFGLPIAAQRLLDASILEMTVPELHPEWFDPSWAKNANYKGSHS